MTAAARRPILGHPVPVSIDLIAVGLVTLADLNEARRVAQARARPVVLDGVQPTSTLEWPEVALKYSIC
jgi:hypothetical protein